MALLWEGQVRQTGKLAQAAPTRAGLPSNKHRELRPFLLFPEDGCLKHPAALAKQGSGHHPQHLSSA